MAVCAHQIQLIKKSLINLETAVDVVPMLRNAHTTALFSMERNNHLLGEAPFALNSTGSGRIEEFFIVQLLFLALSLTPLWEHDDLIRLH